MHAPDTPERDGHQDIGLCQGCGVSARSWQSSVQINARKGLCSMRFPQHPRPSSFSSHTLNGGTVQNHQRHCWRMTQTHLAIGS